MNPEASPSPDKQEADGSLTIALAMFSILLVAYVLMAADRYLFPVLAVNIRREFGFSLSNTGLLTTIFTLGLGIGGLPTGYALSRFSRKSVLLAGIAIFSGATAATTIATGFGSMLACLVASGIGEAMLATAIFALGANYFSRYRATAIGAITLCYGIGGFVGPILATLVLVSYGTWRAPMLAFGLFGFLMIGVIALTVRSWFSEARGVSAVRANDAQGAPSLLNINTIVLTILGPIQGLGVYGVLGMYPTFLRENLHYSATQAGFVVSFYGIGALGAVVGGWIGDRFPPRLVLGTAFVGLAILGYLFFQTWEPMYVREILMLFCGLFASALIYVNVAGYHVKAVKSGLAGRAS
ncbi:MAG TPA: MFS transporter, partial [Candidatus Dormibacteraeota bacterium]|nr:MFS transporter [Candidatus Dormibacteraeota bacterium]